MKTIDAPHSSVPFSSSTYLKFIDAYSKWGALKSGKALHAHLIINGLACSPRVVCKLVEFYVRCKQLPPAQELFDRIPKSGIRGWVAVVGSYAKYGYHEDALRVFGEMRREGFEYDRIVIPSVLKACGKLHDQRTGEKLHSVILKFEFESDAFVACALIDMYSKCNAVVKAKTVFDGMVEKDLGALNAMISGYVQNSFLEEAFGLVEEMKLFDVTPDVVTWNTMISGFSQANDTIMVDKIFRIMDAYGIKPDVISWTAAISGLVQNFRNKEAFATLREMLDAGLFPTPATISGILPAAANMADPRHGKVIHGYSVVAGFQEDVYVKSALVDMYAKCGLISEATSLFQNMSERNSVTWNSMIFGFANHGHSREAIELFNTMLRVQGREVDHLTFTAVFTACGHSGMVELGESLFHLMQEKYRIPPRLEHYACMVDLLGKAGKLAEAYDLIQRMPTEPDSFVWGALLGVCRQHGCVNLAEIAAERLIKLEPESAGSSVVLLNLYADSDKLENAVKVKKMMKRRKLKRFPGCSWILV